MPLAIKQLRENFYKGKAKAFAWPGGYPLQYICTDGGVLCPKCVTANRAQIIRSTGEKQRDGWALEGVEVNWEDPNVLCDNCGGRIPSAYAENESEPKKRLEYLRGELRAERISWGELAELQSLAPFIDPEDIELRQAAGIPEDGAEGDGCAN